MPGGIDYYFAPFSGYAYLGHKALMALAAETGAEVRFKPLLIAKVFAASDTTPPFAQSQPRKSYRIADQARWAAMYGLKMNAEPKHWPTNPALACKAILAAGQMGVSQDAVTFACLKAVWADERDVALPQDLAAALTEADLPANDILAGSETPEITAEMEAITKEAILGEVFGSPTYMVNGQRYWGQDRLSFVAEALKSEVAA